MARFDFGDTRIVLTTNRMVYSFSHHISEENYIRYESRIAPVFHSNFEIYCTSTFFPKI